MQGNDKVIEHLNKILSNELRAINQYFLHSRMLSDWGLDKLNIGYNLSLEDAKNWGLFISKSIKEVESDIFCEPGLFIIKKDGSIYMVNISNMPWARPDLSTFPAKLKFAQDNKYPVRGNY